VHAEVDHTLVVALDVAAHQLLGDLELLLLLLILLFGLGLHLLDGHDGHFLGLLGHRDELVVVGDGHACDAHHALHARHDVHLLLFRAALFYVYHVVP